jgi:hypothetical protein
MDPNTKPSGALQMDGMRRAVAIPFTPATQSMFFKAPPCLRKSDLGALLQKSRYMIFYVLDIQPRD